MQANELMAFLILILTVAIPQAQYAVAQSSDRSDLFE